MFRISFLLSFWLNLHIYILATVFVGLHNLVDSSPSPKFCVSNQKVKQILWKYSFDVARLFLYWKFSTYCWVLDVSTWQMKCICFLWKLKLEEESMVEKRNRVAFIHDWLKDGTNMEMINMFTTCVILTMLISFVFFFFPLFYDLTDNGNSAKKWSTKTISVLCKLDQSRVSVDWYIAYNYFFNEKGATLYCLKFPL